MRRRHLLGGVATGLAALGGCLQLGEPGATPADGGTPTDDRTSTPAGSVRIERVTVAPELVAANSPDSIGTYGDRTEQFVVATVRVEAESSAPARDAFALEADDDSYAPAEDGTGMTNRLWTGGDGGGSHDPYGEREPGGWLVFPVPKPLDAGNVRLTWPGGEYALHGGTVARLSRPPTTFEVREFAASPDVVEVGETATATLRVANVGDVDGTFVGAFNRAGPWIAHAPETAVSLDVAAGETATWEFSHTVEGHGDSDRDREMRFHLDWREEYLTRTVTVRTG